MLGQFRVTYCSLITNYEILLLVINTRLVTLHSCIVKDQLASCVSKRISVSR